VPIIGGNLDYLEITELFSLDLEESSEYERESLSSSSFAKPPMLRAIIPLLRAYV